MTSDREDTSIQSHSIHSAERILREKFGFHRFLPYQEEIIQHILDRDDLLAVLPTGSGKSLCYQIPALLRNGLTVVISPLIALMKDQIDSLMTRNLPVGCLHSSLPQSEREKTLDDIRAGRLKMIYISPERLRDGFFMSSVLAAGQSDTLWAVDEAHCITEWGHDFRTDYLYIPDAIELIGKGSQLAMFTATATPLVRKDILRQMRRETAKTICGSFDRANLYLGCRQTPSKNDKYQTLAELMRRPGPGIIYTATRRQCEDVNRFLLEIGRNSEYYHAGRSTAMRTEVQERFLSNHIDIIVATNAFGMGVDKPDIRFIIHYAHPASIDAYYQEIGRGGRDGERCDCILLFSRFDRKVQERFIINATPDADMIEECFHDVMQNTRHHEFLSLKRPSYETRSIELFEMEKAGVLNRHSVMCGRASIYLSIEYERALDSCSPEQRSVLTALDREFGISRTGYAATVDLNEFRHDCFPDMNTFSLEQTLLQLNVRGIILYRPDDRSICYEVSARSISEDARRKIAKSASARRVFKTKRLKAILDYGRADTCLRRFLLNALADDSGSSQCGFCDNCL
jgi:ATP-dependent DNA helicase RecQ